MHTCFSPWLGGWRQRRLALASGWLRSIVRVGVVLAVGCGEAEPTPATPPEESPCAAPSRIVGEQCIEPGVQDDGCPAGTVGRESGVCQSPGVPPELCAEGFVHDGEASCDPILPAESCPHGQMATPGEVACRPVMPCGNGTWGDIPLEDTTIYVDGAYTGGASDGSMQHPWTTIKAALGNAPANSHVAVAAGSYVEDVVFAKRVRLWGVCPERVEVAGTAAGLAALFLGPGASGSEVHGVAITGVGIALGVSGAKEALIERVWVHDAGGRGVNAESTFGTTSFALRDSLIELNSGVGVFVSSSEATLQGVVVRGTRPKLKEAGRGIIIEHDPSTVKLARAAIQGAVVEENVEVGVFVAGAEMMAKGLVVRRTLPHATNKAGGWGLNVQSDPMTDRPSSVDVRSSLFDQNHEIGVAVVASELSAEGLVVRRTLASAADQTLGRGIHVQFDQATGARARATVTMSLVEDNRELGLFVESSDVTLEGLLVRGTLPRMSDLRSGRGVSIQLSHGGSDVDAVLRGLVVENNHDTGIFVGGTRATMEGVLVRGTLARASDDTGGHGIMIQPHPETGAPASATVTGARIEQNHEFGVLVFGSQATLHGVLVETTLPGAASGAYGDGLAVATATLRGAALEATAVSTFSRIERNARAGLANFDAHVALGDVALSCNAFDLNGESVPGSNFTFDNLGGNGCGCPEPVGACAAQSSGLSPPSPLEDSL